MTMNYDKSDVVFVVENSLSFKKYLPELMEAYINPTTSYFSGGLSEDTDVYFTQSCLVQYSAIFFGCEMNMVGSWADIEVAGPTSSEKEILHAIQNATYASRNTTRQGFITEGLSAAINLFKKLESRQTTEPSRKCCILVAQSVPFIHSWGMDTLDKVVQQLQMANIKLSIISPHKFTELYRLFEATGGEQSSIKLKNYATKIQHQVLLNGYSLQERVVMPSLASQSTTAANNANQTASNLNPPPGSNTGGPLGPAIPSPSQSVGSPSSQQNTQLQQQQSQQPPGMIRQQSPVQMNVNNNPNLAMNMPNQQVPGMMRPLVQPNIIPGILPRVRWPNNGGGIIQPNMNQSNQQQQPGQQPPNQMQQQQPNSQQQMPNINPGSLMQSNVPNMPMPQRFMNSNVPIGSKIPQSQRITVWQGTIEWHEKKNDNQRIPNQIKCSITASPNSAGEPEVKTDGWCSSLQMQLIRKNILGSIGNTYFQHLYTVMLEIEPSLSLDLLTGLLGRGMAGCIFLNQPNEVKVIVLLFSPDKKAYVGFIPIDQASFYNKIRDACQSQRNPNMNKKVGQVQQQMGVPTGITMSVSGQNIGTTSAQNMQSITSNAGGGMNSIGIRAPNNMLLHQNTGMTQTRPGTSMNQGLLAGGQVAQGPGMNQPVSQSMMNNTMNRPNLNLQQQLQQQQQQQQQQHQNDNLIMRQNTNQQLQLPLQQQQQQQRPMNQAVLGGPGLGPRMQQGQMQNQGGLRQLLAHRLQPHQAQQQQQPQQQLIMMQQGGMRTQMNQGQVINQQQMNQQVLNQQVLNQQSMAQQGIGQDDYMDLI